MSSLDSLPARSKSGLTSWYTLFLPLAAVFVCPPKCLASPPLLWRDSDVRMRAFGGSLRQYFPPIFTCMVTKNISIPVSSANRKAPTGHKV